MKLEGAGFKQLTLTYIIQALGERGAVVTVIHGG